MPHLTKKLFLLRSFFNKVKLIRFEFRKEIGIRCAYKTNRFLRKRRHDDIFMHIKFLNCLCVYIY